MSDELNKDGNLKERFEAVLKRFTISQNRAGKDMGYTGSTVSQYLSGTYKGDLAKVEEAIIRWIVRMEEAATRKHIPIVETSGIKRVMNAIRLAHEEKDIALIVGRAGSSKTTSAEKYAAENERNTILIKVNDSMNKKVFTQAVARELGIETIRVPFNILVDTVSSTLSDRNIVVIIDEADGLKDDALEFSRRLVNDLGQSGLVLIGLPRLANRIQMLKNDHQQLESRIGVFLQLDGLSKVDAEKIVEAVWEDAGSDIVEAIYRIAQTDVRRFTKIISRCQNLMAVNKTPKPDVELIEMAGSMILRRVRE